MSTFEVGIPILVAFHTQSLKPHLKVRKTLYLVNPFRIKFKVTLNIGPTEVLVPFVMNLQAPIVAELTNHATSLAGEGHFWHIRVQFSFACIWLSMLFYCCNNLNHLC
jgi:hypothetical protein